MHTRNLFKLSPMALAVFAALTANASEQATTNKAVTLDKVTVAATLTEQKIKDVANSVSVIDSEEIANNGATDIREMLRYETGIEVGSAGRFGLKGFNIRGMDENDIKILVDGVTQDDAFGAGGPFQQVYRNTFEIDSLKLVEVVKGPGSTLYGSNSIGGTVAFTTKDPADYLKTQGDDFAATLSSGYNSADEETRATITLANRSGNLETLLMYTRRDGSELETQGTISGEGEDRTVANPAEAETDNILAKIQYQLTEGHRLELTLEDYQNQVVTQLLNENAVNDYTSYFGPGAFLAYQDKRADDSIERQRLSLKHIWQANNAAFDRMTWQLSQQSTDVAHKTFDIVDASPSVAGAFRLNTGERVKAYGHQVDSNQLDLTLNKQSGDHIITYGLNYLDKETSNKTNTLYLEGQAETESGRYIPKVDGTSLGIFAQVQLSLMDGNLLLTPGVRYDDFEASATADERFPLELKDHESDKTSLRLGGVYKFNDSTSVFAQYAQGFKTPDIHDLYNERDGGRYLSLANPDLKPEESDSFEIGFRSEGNAGSIEIATFYNKYDNYIDSIYLNYDAPYTSGVSQDRNIADATIKGAELRSTLWLDETIGAPLGMSLHTSLAYADGEGKDNSDAENEPLQSINPLKAVIGLRYEEPKGQWGGTLNTTMVKGKGEGQVPALDSVEEEQFIPAGYTLLDLSAYYKPTQNLTLRASVNNITDKKYWVWDDIRGEDKAETNLDRFTQPGRNFALSVDYIF